MRGEFRLEPGPVGEVNTVLAAEFWIGQRYLAASLADQLQDHQDWDYLVYVIDSVVAATNDNGDPGIVCQPSNTWDVWTRHMNPLDGKDQPENIPSRRKDQLIADIHRLPRPLVANFFADEGGAYYLPKIGQIFIGAWTNGNSDSFAYGQYIPHLDESISIPDLLRIFYRQSTGK